VAQLHEYQAKRILAKHGVAIPRGQAAKTAAEAREIAERLGGNVVVKAQIHSTSRAASGGIRFAQTADEAEQIAAEMLGTEIAGNTVEAVLIDERAEIQREFYLGFIVDDKLKRPTLLFSGAGGSGIEERAATMRKLVCSIRREPDLAALKNFAFQSAYSSFLESKVLFGEESDVLAARLSLELAEILRKLYLVAKSCEARVAEINPLALLKDGRLIALDARISVDDYAVFRHEDLGIEMARELGHTPTKLERIAWEIEKDDFRGTFYFVEILPSAECGVRNAESETENQTPHSALRTPHLIGFHGAGGGGSMASLDAAQRNGLQPGCYVDTSGNPPASKVYRATKIILSIPGIKGYFLSGSGVASQEQFGLARAVIKAFREVRPNIPAVLRLGGNGEDYAKELVEKYTADLPAPVEAYQKKHSADFCAARLEELIFNAKAQRREDAKEEIQSRISTDEYGSESNGQRTTDNGQLYKFKTRTGEITYDHSVFETVDAAPIVEACPVKILKLDERRLPILAITPEEAERGKCIECLACEFASWEFETGGVKIDSPIEGLE
jgi:succinyl-CoA synthetase beta subunit